MKPSNLSILLMALLCFLLPHMISGFWVAPMWGNKVEGEAYGPVVSGGSSGIPAHHGTGRTSQVYGQPENDYAKYPGWISRKQGMPISGTFGKRYGQKTLWSMLFDCSIDPSKCNHDARPENEAAYH